MNEFLINRALDFSMILIGLVVAALPFIVFGVIVSVLISKYVTTEWIATHKSSNPLLAHIQTMSIGLLMPVCECGNIPVANRLTKIGFKPSEVITFVLAAPLLNPIVFITTFVAFNLDPNIAYIRIIAGALIALFVGLMFRLVPDQNELLSKPAPTNYSDEHTSHIHTEDCHVDTHQHNYGILTTFVNEFFTVFNMLVIGAAIAAAFQVLIPRSFVTMFADNLLFSIVILMILAFVVSICSTIDAFFALSFIGNFSVGAILAFLIFGPMIDIKSLLMMNTIFKPKTLFLMSVIVALLCVALGLTVDVFYKSTYSL